MAFILIRLFFLSILFFPLTLQASEMDIPRKILAFYDSKANQDVATTNIHRHAEMPLNYLGLEVVYRSTIQSLPPESEMQGVRGVLSWFERVDAVPHPEEYCRWLVHQMEKGRRVVILGDPGVFKDSRRMMSPPCLEVFRTLGLEYQGQSSDNAYFFEIVSKDSTMVEFERKLIFTEKLFYSKFQKKKADVRSYLTLKRSDLPQSDSVLAMASPRGGFVYKSYVKYDDRDLNKMHWRLQPFLFFEEAFGVAGLPRPDVTTLNGRRIFYSQIDGDGVVNISHIDQKRYSGEVIYDEILRKYAHVPITVGLITGYFHLPEFYSDRVRKLYQNIFELPNIEAGSHGYAHPFVWRTGVLALKIPGYQYKAEQEIDGSMKLLRDLLEVMKIKKPVSLFQWTGDCLPGEMEVARPWQLHVKNINGGGGRFDHDHDSYAFLLPLSIQRGPWRQIYASNFNENNYTNLWHGPYFGYSEVIETFKNTESPYRVKPIDVYYHFYSGERMASLKALQDVYDFALSQEIFSMQTSDYAQLVADFFPLKIRRLKEGFQILNAGTVRTIRFDREMRAVDLERSRGVLGFRHHEGHLYVALDESPEHVLFLSHEKPQRPYVEEANFLLQNFRGNRARVTFLKKGWLPDEIILAGMVPQRTYRVDSGAQSFVAKSDSEGRLKVVFPSQTEVSFQGVTITLESI